jgi:hypothetical protein
MPRAHFAASNQQRGSSMRVDAVLDPMQGRA